MNEWLKSILQNLAASLIWTVIVSVVTVGVIRTWNRWKLNQRLRALRAAAHEGAVALCVRIGGRGAPLPDVEQFLRENQPTIRTVLYYDAPSQADLADPTIATAIIEDLREMVTEYGHNRLSEIHFFPAGMLAYPFALGAMLSNWCPVVVYHLNQGAYVPLYRLNKELIQRNQRTTSNLAKMQIHTIDASSRPAIAVTDTIAASPQLEQRQPVAAAPQAVAAPDTTIHTAITTQPATPPEEIQQTLKPKP